jgi:hypothetical protein
MRLGLTVFAGFEPVGRDVVLVCMGAQPSPVERVGVVAASR